MARPGYGKRSVPDQEPRTARAFAHLPTREASVAAHIDRLPDGAAMDIKTLAKELAAYGQQAVASALKAISAAGHLRRVRERLGDDRTQWVQRTYFSRTPRSDAWWGQFLSGDSPAEASAVSPPPVHPPERTAAYTALAGLGRTDARMTLSAAECTALEPLATEWLTRGVPVPHLVQVLTDRLPGTVHAPGALARKRLTDKMPPTPEPEPVRTRIMECTGCGIPGLPEALPGGLCRTCRHEDGHPSPTAPIDAGVRAHVAHLRVLARTSR
ncbi:hypothetical protein ACWD4B_30030 [Streptomyces sp. NPDC002536]